MRNWINKTQFRTSLMSEVCPDKRCNLVDGCFVGTHIWISHKRKAIYYETPKAASRTMVNLLGLWNNYLWPYQSQIEFEDILNESSTLSDISKEFGKTKAATIYLSGYFMEVKNRQSKTICHEAISIADYKYRQMLDKGNRSYYSGGIKKKPEKIKAFQIFYGTPAESAKLFSNYYKFSVIRDPYERMVSNYCMFIGDRRDVRIAQIKALFGEYREYTLVEFLQLAKLYHNHHWEEYRCFLPGDGPDYGLDKLFLMDRLNRQLLALKWRLKIWSRIQKNNQSKHNSYADFYNEKSTKLVEELLPHDVEAWNAIKGKQLNE